MADLFSFLNDAPDDDDEQMEVENVPALTNSSLLKRKAGIVPPVEAEEEDDLNEPGPSTPKKPRLSSPKPIVLDDFETEAKREVAASAGLTGSVDSGSRLELKHQVCFAGTSSIQASRTIPGSTSSRGTTRV